MEQFSHAELALEESKKLLALEDFENAVSIYNEILINHGDFVRARLNNVEALQMHKELLKCHIVLDLIKQKKIDNGFFINLGHYPLLDRPSPNIFIGPKTINAINQYKGPCKSIQNLARGVLTKVIGRPETTTLIYCAHSVPSDLIDMCRISGFVPMKNVLDIGAGAGVQAIGLSLLQPQIEFIQLFEQHDFMKESIIEIFKLNQFENYSLNVPMKTPIDFIYSFRACGYIFSVDTYYDYIQKFKTSNSFSLIDVGSPQNTDYECSRLIELYKEARVMYHYGQIPMQYSRVLAGEIEGKPWRD